jgi:hypothetical protein
VGPVPGFFGYCYSIPCFKLGCRAFLLKQIQILLRFHALVHVALGAAPCLVRGDKGAHNNEDFTSLLSH